MGIKLPVEMDGAEPVRNTHTQKRNSIVYRLSFFSSVPKKHGPQVLVLI